MSLKALTKLLLFGMLLPISVLAQTGPASLNVSGGLFNPNGTAILDTSVNFKVDVYDANATCLLYSEQHLGQDLSNTKGGFSLQLGSGSSQVNYLENSAAFDRNLFVNTGAVAAFNGCPSGVTFNVGDTRVVRVSYDVGQGFVTMTPDVPVTSTPYAMVADTLQGLPASGFVKTDGVSLTQANVANIFSNINYPKLEALLSGTSGQYISSAPGASVSFNAQLLTNIADPTAAQDAATKNYVDKDLGGLPITIAGIGAGMGGGKTLVWDQTADAWVAQTAGTVTYVGGGTGLLGGGFSSQGTLAVDVGTSANKVLQLSALAQIPGVDGSLLFNVNATRLASREVSTVAPSLGQILGWNSSSLQWEPQINAGITALTGDVHANGPGSASSTIQPNAVNLSSKINNSGNGPNQLLITDPTTGTTIGYGTCTIAGQVYQWTAGGWVCVSVTALLGNSSVAAATYGSSSVVPQITVDATGRVTNLTNVNIAYPVLSVNGKTGVVILNGADLGLGTASTQNYGSAPGDLPQLDSNGLIPLGELPTGTGTITGVSPGTALFGGGTSGLVTLSVDVGVTANKVIQFNAQAQYPGNDGSLITNLNAVRIGTRTVSTNSPIGGQVLGWNMTNGDWEPASGASGSVTNISSGTGLTGGPIATSGTLAVDVGTAANKILQVTTAGIYPSDDGSLISNLNASRIGTRTVSTSMPLGGQVLGWNTTNGDWEPASIASGTVTSIFGGNGLTGGPITTTGTLNVDVGTAANQILQVTANGAYPQVDGYVISNVNAVNLAGKPLASSSATAGQVLTFNGTLGKWDAENSNYITGFINGGNLFGSGATLGTNDNNSLSFRTNNSVAMTILANGNVGIGTGTPSGLLQVYSSSGTGTLMTITDGATSGSTANELEVMNSGSNNTTINVTNYQTSATVGPQIVGRRAQGSLSAATATSANNRLLSLVGQGYTGSAWSGSSSAVIFYSAEAFTPTANGSSISLETTPTGSTTRSARMTIAPSGGIGIGTASPAAILDLNGLGTAQSAMIIPRDTVANRPSSPVNGMIRYASDTAKFEVYQGGTWQNMIAATNGTLTSLFSGTGLVGGTITSVGTLAVDVGTAANKIIQLTSTGLLPAVDGSLLTNLTSANGFVKGGNSFGSAATLGLKDDYSLSFLTNNAAAMTILTNGYIGIGNTTPDQNLEIGNASSNHVTIHLYDTGYANPTADSVYSIGDKLVTWSGGYVKTAVGNDAYGMYLQASGGPNSHLGFWTGPTSGVAPFERMRLDAYGNMGVGTSTPAAILDVYGLGTGQSAMIIPRDTIANRPSTPVNGMIRYASDSGKFEVYQSGSWTNLTGGSASGAPLSGLTNAMGGNTIDNLNYAQTWNWSTATTQTPLAMSANTLTNGSLLTLSSSSPGLNSTAGLLDVANLGTSQTGLVARIQANSATESGLTILANGNVGIGTSAPDAALDVQGSILARGLSSTNVGKVARLGYDTLNDFSEVLSYDFGSSTFKPLRLRGSSVSVAPEGGFVGISGIAVPVAPLQVNGAAAPPSLAADSEIVNVQASSTVQLAMGAYATTPFAFWLQTKQSSNSGASFPLVLNPTGGNVGIGTSNPGSVLDINGVVTAEGGMLIGQGGNELIFEGGTNTAGIRAGVPGAYKYFYFAANGTLEATNGGAYLNGNVGIGTYLPTAMLDVEGAGGVLFNAGNVGIGTTSPIYPVDIRNTSFATQFHLSTDNADDGAYLMGSSGGNWLSSNASYTAGTWVAKATSAGIISTVGGTTYIYADQGLTSGTSFTPSARMAVTAQGYVGIGTSAPGATLDVDGHIANSQTSGTLSVSSCGNGTISGNDTRGIVTLGSTAVTSCTINFSTAFASAPYCIAGSNSGATVGVVYVSSTSTTQLVLHFTISTSSAPVTYICIQ